MFAHFNQRTRAAVSSLAFAALTATAPNNSAEAAQNDAWWLKPGVLPATPSLRVREVDVNVRSITGMVMKERQCEINGTALPVLSGIIPDTGHFYGISLDGKDRHCAFIPLVSIKPQNPTTAQELMTEIASKAPNIAAILQGKPATGIPQLDQAYAPRQVPGVGIAVPAETAMGYMLIAGIRQDAQRMSIPTANPCTTAGPDTDGDGIPDIVERQGALDLDGTRFTSDPNKLDSDDDGLTDGEEIGEPLDYATAQQRATARGINPASLDPQACYYDVKSNPLMRDTDSDFIEDGQEVDEGTDPRKADTDGDGLSDGGEKLWGTDPLNRDTDGDGYDDSYEIDNAKWGYNPLVPDRSYTTAAFLGLVEAGAKAAKGAGCGDFCDLNSIPELAGAIVAGVIPVAGTVADVRDYFANAIKGDRVGMFFSALGTIPVEGDTARSAQLAVKYIEKHPEQINDVFSLIARADYLPEKARTNLLMTTMEATIKDVKYGLVVRHGIKPETISRLSKGRAMNPTQLLKELDECGNCLRKDVSGYSLAGWMQRPVDAEKFFPGSNPRPGILPPPPRKPTDARYYDSIDRSVAKEVKSGYVDNNARIRRQIEKDCNMKVNRRAGLNGIEWHFFASNDSNSIGAAPAVLEALRSCKNGPIPYFIHMP